nr:glycosyltransferase family 9 protein [Candidatus Krumholzibacteria bacterium]
MKLLVTRTDRLGDLVLSLPVIPFLKAQRPGLELHMLVAPGTVPLVECHPEVAKVWTWVPNDPCVRRDLLRAFRKEGFDAVLMLQYDHQLATLLRKAGIPLRYGPYSRLSSWFQLNRGMRQNRSRCRHHEMDYNLQLAAKVVGGDLSGDHPDPVLHLAEGQREKGREFRQERAPGAQVVAFVHPGSGGSALDWDPVRFVGVANSLAALEGFAVFITGAGDDARFVNLMRPLLQPEVGVLLDQFPLRDFLGVLAAGDLMIGPSTGPLHLAAALGLATVGLYPPVATMSPDRWGPRGPLVRTLEPPVACPADRYCHGEKCEFHNCLKMIYERDVLDLALALLKEKEARSHPREELS